MFSTTATFASCCLPGGNFASGRGRQISWAQPTFRSPTLPYAQSSFTTPPLPTKRLRLVMRPSVSNSAQRSTPESDGK